MQTTIRLEVNKVNVNTDIIEALLAKRGMSKTALSEQSGICRANISVILRRGTCEPRTAGKLAAGLGVPVEHIVKLSQKGEVE